MIEAKRDHWAQIKNWLGNARNRLEAYSSGNRDVEFETESTLGLEPSLPSGTGWTVYHPALDPNIDFQLKTKYPLRPRMTFEGETVWPSISTTDGIIFSITAYPYTDSRGMKRVVLEIYSGIDKKYMVYPCFDPSGKVVDRKLVRDELLGDDVNSRVVVFQKEAELPRYFEITPADDNQNTISLVEVTPKQIAPST